MSKIAVIREIRTKLQNLGTDKNGCQNLNIELPNGNKLSWVGFNQLMVSVRLGGTLYRNKRYPLYSKHIDVDMLNLINSRLS